MIAHRRRSLGCGFRGANPSVNGPAANFGPKGRMLVVDVGVGAAGSVAAASIAAGSVAAGSVAAGLLCRHEETSHRVMV